MWSEERLRREAETERLRTHMTLLSIAVGAGQHGGDLMKLLHRTLENLR